MINELQGGRGEYFASILWWVWREMNDKVWKGRSNDASAVLFLPTSFLTEWKVARLTTNTQTIPAITCKVWHCPPQSYAKANIDAAFFNDTTKMGLRMILHDDDGKFLLCRFLVVSGVLRADEGDDGPLRSSFLVKGVEIGASEN
ncbi:hypothetical protein ACS0TY_010641 [Phlomoides rotata]